MSTTLLIPSSHPTSPLKWFCTISNDHSPEIVALNVRGVWCKTRLAASGSAGGSVPFGPWRLFVLIVCLVVPPFSKNTCFRSHRRCQRWRRGLQLRLYLDRKTHCVMGISAELAAHRWRDCACKIIVDRVPLKGVQMKRMSIMPGTAAGARGMPRTRPRRTPSVQGIRERKFMCETPPTGIGFQARANLHRQRRRNWRSFATLAHNRHLNKRGGGRAPV